MTSGAEEREEKMEVDCSDDFGPADGLDNMEREKTPSKSKKKKKKKDKKNRHKNKEKRKDDCPHEVSNQARDMRILKLLLDQLLSIFEEKDAKKFFAWPVTDQIAPGYSAIITRPMDFSTMRNKVHTDKYASLKSFKEDFDLVCTNAQTYNQPSTVYYKAARKLQHFGRKLMHASKLMEMKAEWPALSELTWDDLSRDFKEVSPSSRSSPCAITATDKDKCVDRDADPDRILERAQKAVADVASELADRKVDPTISFLRQRHDGSTSLNILVPPSKRAMDIDKQLTLGATMGKLTQGTGSIQGFKEDRRNGAKIGKGLYYGPYNTHAPAYDTTFATVNAEEANLLLSAYGSETAANYAEGLRRFCADSEYCLNVANDLLDVLTGGAHGDARLAVRVCDEGLTNVETVPRNSQRADSVPTHTSSSASGGSGVMNMWDFASLKSLKDEGIDVSFLDEMEKEEQLKSSLEAKLKSAGTLIEELKDSQEARLSQPPPQHLSLCPQPSQDEMNLAREVVTTLTDISKEVPPRVIAPISGLRRALVVSCGV